MTLALAGGFLTTVPPGTSLDPKFLKFVFPVDFAMLNLLGPKITCIALEKFKEHQISKVLTFC